QQSANSEDMPDVSWDIIFEDAFRERLKAYLKGRGHPDHPDVHELIPEEIFMRDRDDPLLRARLFLQMMSGCDLVPPEGDWNLKARCFIALRNMVAADYCGSDFLPTHRSARPSAPGARAASGTSVTIDEAVRNLLREDPEGLLFEVWVHGAVLDPDDYNQV
ncbi:hypothetical protein K466DRAFT_571306, partial [Polyporus arcularius HHB13444]